MKFINDNVDFKKLKDNFLDSTPFNHVIIDNFFHDDVADKLAEEFPAFNSDIWHEYSNPIEVKKACNNWNVFPETTYKVFSYLCSEEFSNNISHLLNERSSPDAGLNGGGWHSHRSGGKLNTHLDYSIHPKLDLQRKVNIIVYMSKDWIPEWGGSLGLWSHDEEGNSCGELVKTVDCIFNRAVIFNTTQNSWHGLPEPITCPEDRTRNSLAAYYVGEANSDASDRGKALFVPYKDQSKDQSIIDLIEKRSNVNSASSVYNN
jgi:hypothetical protein